MESILTQCLAYFSARPVYRKLFKKIRDKYVSLGHFGGTVTLTGLTVQEKQELGGFLQKDYTENKTVTVSAALLEKTLRSSRFAALSWEEILEAYYGEPLVGKQEQKLLAARRCEQYFEEILENSRYDVPAEWLREVFEKRGEGYVLLMQQYKENPVQLKALLEKMMEAAARLPMLSGSKKKELLPVFAAGTTGNPHYFDEGTAAEKILLFFIKWYLKAENLHELSGIEYKKRLLYEAGILKDELSNDVLVFGIRAWKNDGTLHEGIEGFFCCQEIMKLTLKTIGNLGKIIGRDKNVYIVENPAVFSVLVEKYPDRTLVCGNGQLKLAVFLLLDRLAESHTLYYAGDFDPEGLQIAQNLKKRYGEKVILWNYRAYFYEKYCSEVLLDDIRLKKLEKIEITGLQEIKKAMLSRKRAAYQEAMIEEFTLSPIL